MLVIPLKEKRSIDPLRGHCSVLRSKNRWSSCLKGVCGDEMRWDQWWYLSFLKRGAPADEMNAIMAVQKVSKKRLIEIPSTIDHASTNVYLMPCSWEQRTTGNYPNCSRVFHPTTWYVSHESLQKCWCLNLRDIVVEATRHLILSKRTQYSKNQSNTVSFHSRQTSCRKRCSIKGSFELLVV